MKFKHFLFFIILILIFHLLPCNALEINVPQAKCINGRYYVVKGEVVDITLKGKPNENINVYINYKFELKSENGAYIFAQNGFPIPISGKFTVKAYPVKNLTVEASLLLFGKKLHAEAKNEVATVSANVPMAGNYNVKLYGYTNYSKVNVECIAETTIELNDKGEYSISYDTSKLPVGRMSVKAGDIDVDVYVVLSENEIPSPTQTTRESNSEPIVTTTVTPVTTIPTTTVKTTVTPKPTTVTTTVTTPSKTTLETPTTPKQTVTTPPATLKETPVQTVNNSTANVKKTKSWAIPGFEIAVTVVSIILITLHRRIRG